MTRLTFLLAMIPVLLQGCGGLDAWTTESQKSSSAETSVELGATEPGRGYRRLDEVSVAVEANCKGLRATNNRSEAQKGLRQNAAAEGADYVWVTGDGPIEGRGKCSDDVFRLDGIAYSREAGASSPGTQPASEEDASERQEQTRKRDRTKSSGAESSQTTGTAEKLSKLERLREQDLISESEYERLRQKVLDEAF